MPNQLFIPFKKTYVAPIRDAVRNYILANHTDTHPDAYRWDITHWEKLRAEVVSTVVHVDRIGAYVRYEPLPSIALCSQAAYVLKLPRPACLHPHKASSRCLSSHHCHVFTLY